MVEKINILTVLKQAEETTNASNNENQIKRGYPTSQNQSLAIKQAAKTKGFVKFGNLPKFKQGTK